METANPIIEAVTKSDEYPHPTGAQVEKPDEAWISNLTFLWAKRRILARAIAIMFVLSTGTAFLMPNQYESAARIMPPQQSGGGAAILAALAGKGATAGNLAGFAGGLLGARSTGALFLSLLHTDTVSGHLISRFQLQHVYRKRYLQDTAKKLARKTTTSEDSKSGVITIVVEDTDRQRARDMAQAYLDELNFLVARVNTSSARREREFIEQRLQTVQRELQQAQVEMSEFSTKNTAIDIREQTRAMVDAGAKLQGQLIASEAELGSLQQIYGNENVRVRSAEARVALLQRELGRNSGNNGTGNDPREQPYDEAHPYPALRQLPALAVPWANLYRRVRIQETVFEMLSAQYETARIEEAKSVPTVSVIDPPGLPEKKSSPHRLIIVLVSTMLAFVIVSLFLLAQRSWLAINPADARRALARQIAAEVALYIPRLRRRSR